jgi:thymidylate synthase (FAD)
VKIIKPSSELIWITPNAAQVIEEAGRTAYKSEDKITPTSAYKFVRNLIHTKKHHSVGEHASASFRVITDRGVSHEFVRHRLASFTQESTRYCNYGMEKHGNQISVIEPPGLKDISLNDDSCDSHSTYPALDSWIKVMSVAEEEYIKLIKLGVKPQIARSILPNSLKTEFVVTANFREWMHIIDLRTSQNAHPQIIEVVKIIRDILAKECPCVFGNDEEYKIFEMELRIKENNIVVFKVEYKTRTDLEWSTNDIIYDSFKESYDYVKSLSDNYGGGQHRIVGYDPKGVKIILI